MERVGRLDLHKYITTNAFDHDDLVYIIRNLHSDVKIYKIQFDPSNPYSSYVTFTSPKFVETKAYVSPPEVTLGTDMFYRYRIPEFKECWETQPNGIITPGSVLYSTVQAYTPPNITPPDPGTKAKCISHTYIMYHGLFDKYKYCKDCGEKE